MPGMCVCRQNHTIWPRAVRAPFHHSLTRHCATHCSNQGALILKIIQGTYKPIDRRYSKNLHKLVKLLLQRKTTLRPTIDQVLMTKVVVTKAEELGIPLPTEIVEGAARQAKKGEPAAAARRSEL